MIGKKTLISIAIALLFALFVGYGIEIVNPTPEYEDFCLPVYPIADEAECVEAGGRWEHPPL